ncbi:MAG: cupin domain-containing protein [Acidimicrobiales bacterium]
MLIDSVGEVSEAPQASVPDAERTSVVAFEDVVVEVDRGGGIRFVPRTPGPPPRVDGHLLALEHLEDSPPHLGERHVDGDELIWLVSGQATVTIEAPDGDQPHVLGPGDALIVARGLWHRVQVDRPARLFHLTPGPSEEHRPLKFRSTPEEP